MATPACGSPRPDGPAAVTIANRIAGPNGGWYTDAEIEVFPRAEYTEHAHPGDFTCMVIDRRRVPQIWLDRQCELHLPRRRAPHPPER